MSSGGVRTAAHQSSVVAGAAWATHGPLMGHTRPSQAVLSQGSEPQTRTALEPEGEEKPVKIRVASSSGDTLSS